MATAEARLPAGQPFGRRELATVAENPSLSIAQWIIWLPAIDRPVRLYAALGVKERKLAWIDGRALAGAFISPP